MNTRSRSAQRLLSGRGFARNGKVVQNAYRSQSSSQGVPAFQQQIDRDRYKNNLGGTKFSESDKSIFDEDSMHGMMGVGWEVGGRQIKLFWDDETSEKTIAPHRDALGGVFGGTTTTLPCDQVGSEAEARSNEAEKQLKAFNDKKAQLLSSMANADKNSPITEHMPLPGDLPPAERAMHEKMVKSMGGTGSFAGGISSGTNPQARNRGAMMAQAMTGGGVDRSGLSGAPNPTYEAPKADEGPHLSGVSHEKATAAAKKKAAMQTQGSGEFNLPKPVDILAEMKAQKQADEEAKEQDKQNVSDYYKSMPRAVDKDELWKRIQREAAKDAREEAIVDGNNLEAADPTFHPISDVKAKKANAAKEQTAKKDEKPAAAAAAAPKKQSLADIGRKSAGTKSLHDDEAQKRAEEIKRKTGTTDAASMRKAGYSTDSSDLSKDPSYVDHIRNEEDIKAKSWFTYNVGQWAFEDEMDRQDYYACHILCMALNKARWNHIDVASQRGTTTTGVGVRTMFWKESLHKIIQTGDMVSGQFVDAHPILRPFANVVKRKKLTKAFMRGFVDSRLRVLPQPGNMEQLVGHFDKTHGYFYNMLLEVMGRKDDNLEHMMKHIGRAVGIVQGVMLWRKLALFGHTQFPADKCAKYSVNVALLMNTALANRDLCVRNLIHECCQVAFEELRHAAQLANDVDPVAWPVIIESVFPNYYLQFLQNYSNDVSRFWADADLENYGFRWYVQKKMWHWNRHHDVAELLNSAAPVPFLGVSWGYKGIDFVEEKAEQAQDESRKEWMDRAVAQGGIGGMKLNKKDADKAAAAKK